MGMLTIPLVFAMGFALVAWIILAVGRGEERKHAAVQLEVCMDRGNETCVRSLLLVRGHLLRKDVRDAAQVWLIERDNARKDG